MVTSIHFNQTSAVAQSEWRTHTKTIQRSLERLSTGKRINHAGDNAASSAISTRLEAQLRGISAAVRNSQDAFSLAQTGEAALGEMQTHLYRLRELTLQSLNDTYQDQDITTIEAEVREEVETLQEIVIGARFNQKSLFDGSFRAQQLQVGSGIEESLFVSLQDLRTSFLGRRTVMETSSGVDASQSLLMGVGGDTFTLNGVTIQESQASDDAVSVIDPENSAIAKAAAINAVSEQTGVTAYVTETRTDAQATLNDHLILQTFGSTGSVQEVNLTGSTYIEINHVKIGGFTVRQNDQDGSLVSAINEVTEETGVYAELNHNQELVLIAPDGRNIVVDYYGDSNGFDLQADIGLLSGNDNTAPEARFGDAYGGGLRLESLYTVEANFGLEVNVSLGDFVGDYDHEYDALFVAKESSALSQLSFNSRSSRNQALKSIDTAIEQISSQRAFLGGLQSRLESNMNTLHQRYDSVNATMSRVVDTDFAEEVSKLTLHQIKLDALASVMQRAPVLNEQLLSLLNPTE